MCLGFAYPWGRRVARWDAAVEIRGEPVPHIDRKSVAGCEVVGISHWLSRFCARSPGTSPTGKKLGRLRFRQSSPGPSAFARMSDRGGDLSGQVLTRGVFNQFSAKRALRIWVSRDCGPISLGENPRWEFDVFVERIGSWRSAIDHTRKRRSSRS